jgi:hypothetical protein
MHSNMIGLYVHSSYVHVQRLPRGRTSCLSNLFYVLVSLPDTARAAKQVKYVIISLLCAAAPLSSA